MSGDLSRIDFASLTAASALPLLRDQYGEDVTCSKSKVWANVLYS